MLLSVMASQHPAESAIKENIKDKEYDPYDLDDEKSPYRDGMVPKDIYRQMKRKFEDKVVKMSIEINDNKNEIKNHKLDYSHLERRYDNLKESKKNSIVEYLFKSIKLIISAVACVGFI